MEDATNAGYVERPGCVTAYAIFCLIPVVTIAILTLLGPQIGNVFSRVTTGLGATPLPR